MEIDTKINILLSNPSEVKYYEKQNKCENGIMVFSLYEIKMTSKSVEDKAKTDKIIPYADISSINIETEDKILLNLSDKGCQITIIVKEPTNVIKCIFTALKLSFPCEDVFSFISVKNEASLPLDVIKQEIKDLDVQIQSPCNNFTFGVKFYAKNKDLPENDEIIWDIDFVYAHKETNRFVLKDFDHLKPRYIFPVFGAMCYNTFFTELCLSFVDLTPYEKFLEKLFKSNTKFQKLYFNSCNLKISFCTSIVGGLLAQRNLKALDFSNNEGLGDKGLDALIPFLKKHSRGLEVFKMSGCDLSSIAVSKLADAFTHNIKGNNDSFMELRILDLSNNLLRDSFKDIFFDFISKCRHLEELYLANMNSSIEMIAKYLSMGPVGTLKIVDISENISPLSTQSCTQWSNFFSNAQCLKSINISNFKSLDGSITDGLMFGVESNTTLSLTGVEVIISNSSFNLDNFVRFCDFIYKAKAVTSLDISSNGIGLDFQNLLNKLPEFPSLKSLNISNNFNGLKIKEQQNILSQMTSILQMETVNLQELYMSNCNFGSSLSVFVSELDSYFSIRVLDISSNHIGNIVARTLGRVLTMDRHTREIMLDNNNISKEIYEEILDGLDTNYCLSVFYIPIIDLAKYPPKTVSTIIDKINKRHKKVNEMYQGISFEDIKTLAFNSIVNQTAESIDKCKESLQESCNRLKSIKTDDDHMKHAISKCMKLSMENINSIDLSKNIISNLNLIFKQNDNSELVTDLRIKKIMEKVSNEIVIIINKYMEDVVSEMMNKVGVLLPGVLSNNESLRQELNDACGDVMTIPRGYLDKLFSRFVEKNLLKKVYETLANVVNAISDHITDHLINQMNVCDIAANRLISSLKNTTQVSNIPPEDPDSRSDTNKTLIRTFDSRNRNQQTSRRTSRMSHFAASKARPLSRALTSIKSNKGTTDIENEDKSSHEVKSSNTLEAKRTRPKLDIPSTVPGSNQNASADKKYNYTDSKQTNSSSSEESSNVNSVSPGGLEASKALSGLKSDRKPNINSSCSASPTSSELTGMNSPKNDTQRIVIRSSKSAIKKSSDEVQCKKEQPNDKRNNLANLSDVDM